MIILSGSVLPARISTGGHARTGKELFVTPVLLGEVFLFINRSYVLKKGEVFNV